MPFGLLSRKGRKQESEYIEPPSTQDAPTQTASSDKTPVATKSENAGLDHTNNKKKLGTSSSSFRKRSTSANPFTTILTWKEAHHEFCLSRSVLCASIKQVLMQNNNTNGKLELSDYPDSLDHDVLLWNERQKASLEIFERFQTAALSYQLKDNHMSNEPTRVQQLTTPSKSSSSYFSLAYSAASQAANLAMMPFDILTSPLAGKSGDYDDPPPLMTDDFIVDMDKQPTEPGPPRRSALVDTDEAILNIELTLSCLEFLKNVVRIGPPKILQLSGSLPTTLAAEILDGMMDAADASQYTDDIDMVTFISKLPTQQSTFLLDVLIASGHLQRINRQQLGKSDLLVFPDHSTTVDVQVAIYDLGEAMKQIEKRISALENQAKLAIQNAKQCKSKGNIKAALFQVQRKKNFQKEIENSYGHLANLEQQKMALERAGDTHRIHQAMQQTAETLRNLRLSKQSLQSGQSPEEVVDVLAEELELVDATALAMTTDIVASEFDEEELLKELESYPDPTPASSSVDDGKQSRMEEDVREEQEDDIDVDDLLAEMDLLTIDNKVKRTKTSRGGKSQGAVSSKSQSGTIQASVYGTSTSTVKASLKVEKKKQQPTAKEARKSRGKAGEKEPSLARAVCL